ncbi:MAG TPA: DUF2268 domain-containing putative Zn-dependent protease [Gemmatimonadaceae bacterium]|nr:DUF2268 domain-containing putative Zn-dependent protease [Gemmatimonadaceae bacterium]
MHRPIHHMSPVRHVAILVVIAACVHSAVPGTASSGGDVVLSPAGRWEGVAHLRSAAPVQLTITLDSTNGAWRGTLLAPAIDSAPIPFTSVDRTRDSIVLRLPASAQNAVLRGRLSADGERFDGTITSSDPGVTFSTARAGTPDAASLVAEVSRVEASRRLAAHMADSSAADSSVAAPYTDPDSAKLITSDIALFWSAVDHAPPDSLAAYLQRDYLDRSSVGVLDFIRGRIMSAEDLAAYVRGHRARYDSVRAANVDITKAEPGIRAAFRKLKAIYPPAVFPDVYFVIGRFNSGGTASKHGLLIGAEMYRDPNRLPPIVAHELIHFQQHYEGSTLLRQAFAEGSADFVGEMISGTQINNKAHQYGLAHEHALWQEFKPHFEDHSFFPWMYGTPPDGRPNDLGYVIGYRIAQAYYNRMADKRQAIRDIITGHDGDVKALLAKSGYNP